MMKSVQTIAVLAILLSFGTNVWAEQDRSRGRDSGVSERDAARIIRSEKGGKVLGVQKRDDRDYRVKTLDRGRVRVYGVDGRTGEIRE